jgi:hypothetical protein
MTLAEWESRRDAVEKDLRISKLSDGKSREADCASLEQYLAWIKKKAALAQGMEASTKIDWAQYRMMS